MDKAKRGRLSARVIEDSGWISYLAGREKACKVLE
jgi:hypothetical protein